MREGFVSGRRNPGTSFPRTSNSNLAPSPEFECRMTHHYPHSARPCSCTVSGTEPHHCPHCSQQQMQLLQSRDPRLCYTPPLPPLPLNSPPQHFCPLLLLCCLCRILQSWIVGPRFESTGQAAVPPSVVPPYSSSQPSSPSPPSLMPPSWSPPLLSPLPSSFSPPTPRSAVPPPPSPLSPSSPLPPPSPLPSPTPLSPASYVFIGCYKDTPIRALPSQLDNNGGLTAEVSVSYTHTFEAHMHTTN